MYQVKKQKEETVTVCVCVGGRVAQVGGGEENAERHLRQNLKENNLGSKGIKTQDSEEAPLSGLEQVKKEGHL